MSPERRALLIGFIGPALQAVGLTWQALHLFVAHWSETLTARHLIYEPGVLLMIVGFFVSLVCLPVALDVVRASETDVEIPVYEPEAGDAMPAAAPRYRRSRASR
jgi:hypothetical protein